MEKQNLISYPVATGVGSNLLYQEYLLQEENMKEKWIESITEWFKKFINKEAITEISGPIIMTDAQYVHVNGYKIKLGAHITTPEGSITYKNGEKVSKAYRLELYAAGIQTSLESLKNPLNNSSIVLSFTQCIAGIYTEHLKNYFNVLFGINKNYLNEYKKIFPETVDHDSFNLDDFYDYVTSFWDASKNMNEAVRLVNLGLKSIKEPALKPCLVGSNDIFSLMARLKENKSYFLSGNKKGENLKNKDDENFFPNTFTFVSDLKVSNIPVISVNSSHTDEFIKTETSMIGEFVIMNNTDFEPFLNNEIDQFSSKGYNLGWLDRHKKEIVTLRIQDFLNNCPLIGNPNECDKNSIWKKKFIFLQCFDFEIENSEKVNVNFKGETFNNVVNFFKKCLLDTGNKTNTEKMEKFFKEKVVNYLKKVTEDNNYNSKDIEGWFNNLAQTMKLGEKYQKLYSNLELFLKDDKLSQILIYYFNRELSYETLKECVDNDFILPIVPVIIRPFMKFNTKSCCLTTKGAVGYYRGKPLATMTINGDQQVRVGFKIRGGGVPIKPELVFRLPDFDVNKPISGCGCKFMDKNKLNDSSYINPNKNIFPKDRSLMCFYVPLGTEIYIKNHLNMSGEYTYLNKKSIIIEDEHDDNNDGYKGYMDGMKDLWKYCNFSNVKNSDNDESNGNDFIFDLHRTGCVRYEGGSSDNKFTKKKPSFGHFKDDDCFPKIDNVKVSFQNN